MKIGEFFVDLFIDSAAGELSLNKLISAMGELEVVSLAELGIFGEMAKNLSKLTELHVQMAMGIDAVTGATGASTDALQRWRAEMGMAGGNAQTMDSFVTKIVANIAKLEQGGTSPFQSLWNYPEMAAQLGAESDYHSSDPLVAFKVLAKLRQEGSWFQQQNAAKQKNILGEYADILPVVQQSNLPQDLFNRTWKGAPVISDADIANGKKIYHTIKLIEDAVENIGNSIFKWFGPTVQKDLDKFLSLIEKVEGVTKKISGAMGKTVEVINTMMGMIPSALLGRAGIPVPGNEKGGLYDLVTSGRPPIEMGRPGYSLDQLLSAGVGRGPGGPGGGISNNNFYLKVDGDPTDKQMQLARVAMKGVGEGLNRKFQDKQTAWIIDGFGSPTQ